tara:strand:- start:324 stop:776 length:453 start_codon:yes stop_codon:yes gene_type:complete
MYSDHARTFIIEDSSDEDKNKLISVADNALQIGIKNSIAGNKIGIISNSIEEYVLGQGFDVVREYVGHGIGSQLHEPPSVPNFGKKNEGALLRVGMAIAIEPMVTEGKWQTKVMDDKWTVVTKDGKLSSHFEDTILITEDGPEILTKASI